jgi:GntR family transcriptional regulator/MocR family aminotransferase
MRAVFSPVSLGRPSSTPMHRRLAAELRDAVLGGRLAPGTRLPGSRELARDLGLSRNTVLDAMGQLVAEGYLEGRARSGTYVRSDVPLRQTRARGTGGPPAGRAVLSSRGQRLAAVPAGAEDARLPFCPGVPALDEFPRALWARLTSAVLRGEPAQRLNYGDAQGYRPLRAAIAAYVRAARGVHADADQVLVVSGAQQGLDLVARLLLQPGDAAWIEDPGYAGARAALAGAGARLVPIAVDGEGMNVREGRRRSPRARLVHVSPSHQYPLGGTLSLPRRLELLEWARAARAVVVEDDFDSEFQYVGRPAPALQALDGAGSVVYLGTFSRALFPGLRLAYLILPPSLVSAFVRVKGAVDRGAPGVEQAVLARFLSEGHFARHLRRMRVVYRQRRAELLGQAARHLEGRIEIEPAAAGLQVVGWLPEAASDCAVSAALKRRGLGAPPLSGFTVARVMRPGLVLGFAHMRPAEIRSAVRTMEEVLPRRR